MLGIHSGLSAGSAKTPMKGTPPPTPLYTHALCDIPAGAYTPQGSVKPACHTLKISHKDTYSTHKPPFLGHSQPRHAAP
ncbi:MAG: hypothetical protein HN413_08100 [Chloroflexi bacterium]|nr:hypothetical protein [Chloroflexota bacterium]